MTHLSIIKNEQQYSAYCDELERLELMEHRTQAIEDRAELLILFVGY